MSTVSGARLCKMSPLVIRVPCVLQAAYNSTGSIIVTQQPVQVQAACLVEVDGWTDPVQGSVVLSSAMGVLSRGYVGYVAAYVPCLLVARFACVAGSMRRGSDFGVTDDALLK